MRRDRKACKTVMAPSLSSSISSLKGIGAKRQEALRKNGIETLGDLLFRFPNSYRSGKVYPLSSERVGVFSYFHLTVDTSPVILNLKGRGKTLRYVASDESGNAVQVLHFHQPYLKNQIFMGQSLYFGGVLQEKNGVFYLFSPLRESVKPKEDVLFPIYPALGGLSSKQVASLLDQILVDLLSEIPETLPATIIEKFNLIPRTRAVYLMHRPANERSLSSAKYRFAFEELFQFSVQSTLFSIEIEKKRVDSLTCLDLSDFFAALPFSLTNAQRKAIDEICGDLCGCGKIAPMDRLLQGDVGSGKTLVAAAVAYLVAKNGKSTLFMAPTEILAKQHAVGLSKLFSPFGIPVFLLTGSTPKKEREEIFRQTTGEKPYLLIGTHALIEEGTRCGGVLLAITDEQHRFGVRHRNRLGEKGGAIHSLVMSATPIPRSLAMFLHAKSRISIIDELPPGRQKVDTLYVGEDKLPRIYSFLKEQIQGGKQAYVVCPLIQDEEELSPLTSIMDQMKEIQKELPDIPCALLHGKMKPSEKNSVMERFATGQLKLLVSTTVIEVGVDVPNATVMCIRCAERFGLSQLHQLRGRVGRGKEKSYCILISSHSGKSARQRLKKLCDCHDGFELAQFDLKTRGPGEFFGTRQSGFGADPISESFSMEMIRDAGEAARLFLESAAEEELLPYTGTVRLN